MLHELAVRRGELQPHQHALAADIDHDVGIAVLQTIELLGEVAGDFTDVVHQLGLGELFHRSQRHGHGQRIPAVGRAVRADCHTGAGFGAGHAGADREPAAERLGERQDVRLHAIGPLVGEQLAGPAEAALDLVKDQQGPGFVAELAQRLQALLRQRTRAALALYRLDDDRRRGRADSGFQGVHVIEGQLHKARHPGAEAFQIGRIAGGVDRGQRPAVERALKADDVDPLNVAAGPVIFARGLDGALDRLSAGVGEEHLVQPGHVGQHLG